MDGKALFSRNVKPGIFGLSIAPKEIFLVYTTQFVFLTIRLVPGNVVMVAIDMCGKSPITGEWIYGITWKHVYFNISVLFIADTTSILKLVFPATNCFLLPLLLLLLLLFLFICLFIYFVFCLFIHLFCFFVCLFIFFFFWRFNRYSYFCYRCCHRYCCFCCWSSLPFVCVCGYCCC